MHDAPRSRAQALRPDRRPVDLSPLSTDDEPGATGIGAAPAAATAAPLSDAEKAAAARDAARTFASELREAAEGCKAETRKLFAAEGKPLPEGEAGLPDSLKAFIAKELEAGEATRVV
jgi:hypothetical protein